MEVSDSRDPADWLRFAREDLAAARALLDEPRVAPRHVCALAQQSVEKVLKASLLYTGVDPPRIHQLDALRNLLPLSWHVRTEHPDLAELTVWGMEARYPQDSPIVSRNAALKAVAQADRAFSSVMRDLNPQG